jgi:hypothetical protein
MDAFIRGLIISRALFCAAAAAVISMAVIGLLDPQIRNALVTLLLGSLIEALGDPHSPAQANAFLKQAFLNAPFSICVVPVIVVGLTGELIKARSWTWYAADATSAISELRFMPLYLLVGLVAGTIYWLMAGRTDQLAPTPQEWSMK